MDVYGQAMGPPVRRLSARYGHELGPLPRFLFDHYIFPFRSGSDVGGPTVSEAGRANAMAVPWVAAMFTDAEARAWLKVHPYIPAALAAAFREVGISPQQAALRVVSGRVSAEGPTLVTRVLAGELTVEQVPAELERLAG